MLRVLEDLALLEANMGFEESTKFLDHGVRNRSRIAQCPQARVVISDSRREFKLFEIVKRWKKVNLFDLEMRLQLARESPKDVFPNQFHSTR